MRQLARPLSHVAWRASASVRRGARLLGVKWAMLQDFACFKRAYLQNVCKVGFLYWGAAMEIGDALGASSALFGDVSNAASFTK